MESETPRHDPLILQWFLSRIPPVIMASHGFWNLAGRNRHGAPLEGIAELLSQADLKLGRIKFSLQWAASHLSLAIELKQ